MCALKFSKPSPPEYDMPINSSTNIPHSMVIYIFCYLNFLFIFVNAVKTLEIPFHVLIDIFKEQWMELKLILSINYMVGSNNAEDFMFINIPILSTRHINKKEKKIIETLVESWDEIMIYDYLYYIHRYGIYWAENELVHKILFSC